MEACEPADSHWTSRAAFLCERGPCSPRGQVPGKDRSLERAEHIAQWTVTVIAEGLSAPTGLWCEEASLCADLGCARPARAQGLFSPQEFIRLGSLSKLSGKGLQQRMFFLVSRESRLSSLRPHGPGPASAACGARGRREERPAWRCCRFVVHDLVSARAGFQLSPCISAAPVLAPPVQRRLAVHQPGADDLESVQSPRAAPTLWHDREYAAHVGQGLSLWAACSLWARLKGAGARDWDTRGKEGLDQEVRASWLLLGLPREALGPGMLGCLASRMQ